jgi:hypothetical protein
LDFLNQPIYSEALGDPEDLMSGFVNQNGVNGTALKSMDIELSVGDAFKQSQILFSDKLDLETFLLGQELIIEQNLSKAKYGYEENN